MHRLLRKVSHNIMVAKNNVGFYPELARSKISSQSHQYHFDCDKYYFSSNSFSHPRTFSAFGDSIASKITNAS
jgi:hypothetical protein